MAIISGNPLRQQIVFHPAVNAFHTDGSTHEIKGLARVEKRHRIARIRRLGLIEIEYIITDHILHRPELGFIPSVAAHGHHEDPLWSISIAVGGGKGLSG